jgi:acetyltransferase-like isoleucine patch superfamily enzyme
VIRKGIHPSALIDVEGKLELPQSTIIEPGCIIFAGAKATIELGEMNIFYPGCILRLERGFIRTGWRVSFGPGCQIYETRAGLTIGDNTMLAGGVKLCGVNHSYSDASLPMRDQPTVEEPIVIGEDVWIGMGAMVLPGVEIGRGAVVGAGSVVTRSIPPYSVGHGAPFRVTGTRRAPPEEIGAPLAV